MDRIRGESERLSRIVVSLSLALGFVVSVGLLPTVAAQDQGAHLWLELDPGDYFYSHPDPWIEDSWVYLATYIADGVYPATLTVMNRGRNIADTSLLIAIPDTTTSAMFASFQVSGGAGGVATYVLSDFDREDYNPYVHDSTLSGSPIITPYRQYGGGSHGVYPPSGNAIWATYYVGPIASKGSVALQVTLTLGPSPDDSFKVHFDAYSLDHPISGDELRYWTPPSHDATIAPAAVAEEFSADVVDVAGNNEYIAVGGGNKVYYFETSAIGEKLKWSADTGLSVMAVVLSEDGGYLAAVSQSMESPASQPAYLFLYDSLGQPVFPQPQQLDRRVRRDTRILDISRDGKYVAVGTAGWQITADKCVDEDDFPVGGTVYLFENPALTAGGTHAYQRIIGEEFPTDPDCVTSVQFSGNGLHLVAGFGYYEGIDVLSVPDLTLQTSGQASGSPVYGLATSLDASRIGIGQINRIVLWEFDPQNPTAPLVELWRTFTTPGGHRRMTISDNGDYILGKQEEVQPGFHLFDDANPTPSDPEWTYSASDFFPAGVDLSISNPTYGVGVEGVNVHMWGNGIDSPPPGPTPSFEYTTNGIATDTAMGYQGSPGPVFAVTDNSGVLYVFDASLPGLLWTYGI
jgi:hypothetical protein